MSKNVRHFGDTITPGPLGRRDQPVDGNLAMKEDVPERAGRDSEDKVRPGADPVIEGFLAPGPVRSDRALSWRPTVDSAPPAIGTSDSALSISW